MTRLNSNSVKNNKSAVSHVVHNVTFNQKAASQEFFEACAGALYGESQYQTNRMLAAMDSLVETEAGRNFIANVIVYARNCLHLRTMPIVATVEFSKKLRSKNLTFDNLRGLVYTVISRADELTDIVSYGLSVFKDKNHLPLAIKRGVGDAFHKFSPVQLAKYKAETKTVKLRDVIKLTHPKPAFPAQAETFKRIIEGTTAPTRTWEETLSVEGQKGKEGRSKKELWEAMILEEDLGYMAALRNVRNILEAEVSEAAVTKLANFLSNRKAVAKSKQYPFAFVKAYEAIQGKYGESADTLRKAIETALDLSCANIPLLGDKVWIIVDTSGSMQGLPVETAATLALCLARRHPGSVVTQFSNTALPVKYNENISVIKNILAFRRVFQGGGTNLAAALSLYDSIWGEGAPDVILVLSDMQINQGLISYYDSVDYTTRIPAGLKVAINLNSVNTTPVGEQKGFLQLTGFSEKIFDLVPALQNAEATIESLFSKPFVPDNRAPR